MIQNSQVSIEKTDKFNYIDNKKVSISKTPKEKSKDKVEKYM